MVTKLSNFDSFMEKCFNADDNIYDEGPGAGLESNKNLLLCLRNVPKNMDNQALKNILSNYGSVIKISAMNDPSKNFRFAECKNITSLEAILRGMSVNEWNITVSQKTDKKVEEDLHFYSSECEPYTKSVSNEYIVVDDKVLHPCLTNLNLIEYCNKSSETSYFQNELVSEHIYNFRNMENRLEYNSHENIDIRIKEYCKVLHLGPKLQTILENCCVCGEFAIKFCEICQESYCSKECQTFDWPIHISLCKKRISLKSSKLNKQPQHQLKSKSKEYLKELSNLDGKETKIQSGSKIVITHVEKSNLVFIRSIEEKDQNAYIRILNIISSSASTSPQLLSVPKPDDFLLSQYNNEWYRAVVLNSFDEQNILLAYPDIGMTTFRKLIELKELQDELKNLKRFPICVKLKDVKDVVLNEEAKLFIFGLVEENVALKLCYDKKEKSENTIAVELISLESNEHINKRLNILINPTKPTIHEPPILFKDINFFKIKPSQNVKLLILDNSFMELGFLNCIQVNHVGNLEKINTQINEYCEMDDAFYTPRECEICLVKTCNDPVTWYRASCEVVSGNGKPGILLLDYGSMHAISISNIRKFPKQLNVPCFTNQCYIKGLQNSAKTKKIDEQTKIKLQGILKLYETITVPEINLVNGENYITLPIDIIRCIKEQNILYDEK